MYGMMKNLSRNEIFCPYTINMPTTAKTTAQKSTKKGGNLSKDIANLSVPFGLILAQKSLEKYLSQKPAPKKASSSSPKKKTSPKKSTSPTKKTKTVA